MPVPNTMSDLAPVAGDNYPVGSEPIGNNLDNYLRAHAALIRQGNAVASSSMPSGSTVNVANANGESVLITGDVTISSLGSGFVGCKRELRFTSSPTLAHSSNLQLPHGRNIKVAAGQSLIFRCVANGVWACVGGTAITTSLDASQVVSGEFSADRIPDLHANKITDGVLPAARGGTGLSSLNATSYLRTNASGTGIGFMTPEQVRADIGALPVASPQANSSFTLTGDFASLVLRTPNVSALYRVLLNANAGSDGGLSFERNSGGTWTSILRIVSSGVNVTGSVTASAGFQFSGGPRVPRTFVQSGTPAGASDGDLWIW